MTVSQADFHDALLDGTRPIPRGLSDGQGQPAGSRFSVYRNNVAVSLTEALEVSFPAIRKLIGEENFKKVAGIYLRKQPPRTPMLMVYGDTFPDFLVGFEPLQKYAYLPDVARLEQAQREAYHAADADPIDPQVLQTLDSDTLADARLGLAPAVRLVTSPWPIHAIWAFNMVDGAPKPQPGAQTVLVTRPDFDPVLKPVGAGTAAFVDALLDEQTLGEANDAGLSADPDFDLSAALGLLLAGQAIIDVKTEGPKS